MKTIWSVVCVALVLGVVGAAQGAQSFDNLLPDNAIAYVSVRNVPEMVEKLKLTAGYKVFTELRLFERMLPPEKYAEAQNILDTFIKPLGEICTGEVAVAVLGVEFGADAVPEVAVFVDVSGTQDAFDDYLEETVFPLLDEQGLARETQEVAGIEVLKIGIEPDEDNAIFCALKDGVFILSPRLDTLSALLANIGPGPAVAMLPSNAGYADVKRALGQADFSIYVNLGAIIARAVAENDEAAPMWWAVGFSKLRAIGFGTTIGPDGSATSTMRLTTGGPPDGMLGLIARPGEPFTSLKHTPREAGLYYAVDVGSPEELYTKLISMVEEIEVQTAEVHIEEFEEGVAQLEALLGMKLEEEILPAFGGEIALYAKVPEALGIPPAALMIEVTDKETVERLVQRVFDLIGTLGEDAPRLTKAEHKGVEITTVLAAPMISPAVAVLDDYLVVGTSPAAVRSVIDAGPGNNIEAREDFRTTMAGLPTSGCAMAYVDLRAVYEFVFPLLAAAAPDDGPPAELMQALGALGEHLGGFGAVVAGDESGLTYRMHSKSALLESAMIVGPVVIVPAVMRARETAYAAASLSNVKQLAVAVMQYHADYGVTPQRLSELAPYVSSRGVFLHPMNSDKAGLIDLEKPSTIDEHADYELLLKGTNLDEIRDSSETPLIWEKKEFTEGRRVVGFVDGHVQQVLADSAIVVEIEESQ